MVLYIDSFTKLCAYGKVTAIMIVQTNAHKLFKFEFNVYRSII
jgi:hypothetical protein